MRVSGASREREKIIITMYESKVREQMDER